MNISKTRTSILAAAVAAVLAGALPAAATADALKGRLKEIADPRGPRKGDVIVQRPPRDILG